MYRAYANDAEMRINLGIRRRLAPLVGNDRRKMELLDGILFSAARHARDLLRRRDRHGADNVFLGDRNGVRTPMQWSADRNAGFSRANPQRLILPITIDPEYHYEAVNVEGAAEQPELAPVVDEAAHRAAQAVSSLRPRDHRVLDALQSPRARLRAPARRRG